MALSGRRILGKNTALSVNVPLVILNESGQSGMLRIIRVIENAGGTHGGLLIKIEIDGVVYANSAPGDLIDSNDSGDFPMGLAIQKGTATGFDMSARLVNIPFNNSAKITLTNTVAGSTAANVSYSVEYVLGKEVV